MSFFTVFFRTIFSG